MVALYKRHPSSGSLGMGRESERESVMDGTRYKKKSNAEAYLDPGKTWQQRRRLFYAYALTSNRCERGDVGLPPSSPPSSW